MLDRIHKISEIVAAFAIVGSLVFVGLQLNQNTDSLKANAAQVNASSWQELVMGIAANEQLATIWTNSLIEMPAVTVSANTTDTLRLTFVCSAQLKSMEANLLAWVNGDLSDELFEAARQGFILQLTVQPHYERILSGPAGQVYSPQFMNLYRESLVEAKARRAAMTAGQI